MTPSLLDRLPLIGSVRRNHGLEHATMQVLSKKYHDLPMAGFSGPSGFTLVADLPTEIVTDATLEAEQRLKVGESDLAVHPHCGTNLVISLLAAGMASWVTLWSTSGGKKPRFPQIALAIMAAVPAFIFSKPLGPLVQKKVTTSAELGEMRVRQVTSQKIRENFLHKIDTGN